MYCPRAALIPLLCSERSPPASLYLIYQSLTASVYLRKNTSSPYFYHYNQDRPIILILLLPFCAQHRHHYCAQIAYTVQEHHGDCGPARPPIRCAVSSFHAYPRAMGRSNIPPALNELSNPSSPEAQVNALRNLKNEIVGHEQRKELAVVHGIVKPLARLLKGGIRKGGKRRRNGSITNGSGGASAMGRDNEWDVEDELRFQATLVVGSLANGESRRD